MISYFLKSAISLGIMYLPYMLLLRKESFFRLNRMVLLSILLLSLVIPLCDFHFLSAADSPAGGIRVINLPSVVVTATATGGQAHGGMPDWIALIYIIGVALTLAYKLVQLAMLRRQMTHGVLWKDKSDGVTILCHARDIAPYSWMNTIVIGNADYERNADEIIRHEMGHIRHRHSFDILLLNLVQTIQWANPLAWVIGISLRDVHEYEADDAVLNSGVDARQYQTLLIRKAVGSSSYAFANSFNHSLLTKRITMMLREKSSPWMRTKALYIIPVAVIALSAFATPQSNEKADRVAARATAAGKVNQIVPNKEIDQAKTAVMTEKTDTVASKKTDKKSREKVYEVVEQMPSFPGGNMALMEYLGKSIKYPVVAEKYGVQGRVIVQFVVEKDGSVTEAHVIGNLAKGERSGQLNTAISATDDEAAKAEKAKIEEQMQKGEEEGKKALADESLRVINAMPKWTPGKQNGKPIRVQYNVPVSYRLQ